VPKHLSAEAVAQYERDGFYFPIQAISAAEARSIRADVEVAERHLAAQGERLRNRPHLLVTALDRVIRNETVLDAVEDLLGPNLLCWTSLFFTKDAHDPAFVSMHQDSTYWGLSSVEVVTAWIALSPSTVESGAMQFAPGTHKLDQIAHRETYGEHNMLTRGQIVEHEVDEAVDVVLQPGEASLHHVRLIHGSGPNRSDDRRIGFAIRRAVTTATAAMQSAESRKTATKAGPQAGAPGGGPTATLSQRPSVSAADAVNQSGSRWSGLSSSWSSSPS